MALNTRRLAGDFAFALVSQAVGLLVGFANTLLLPKIVSIDTYGYWQLFLFYASYAGVFAFGLIDGVYLILGGERRESIDKRAVNSQFWFCMAYQIAIAVVLIIIGLWPGSDTNRTAVFVGVAVYLVIFNADNFLGYLFQAIGETRRYSLSTMLESIAFFLGMISLIAMQTIDYEPYICAYIVSRFVRLAYCLWFARGFLTSGLLSFTRTIAISFSTMRVGIKLLISTLSGGLIIGVARFLIDLEWGIADFAIVSFALALVNFFMTFTSQAAMVLFPALRRVDMEELARLFVKMRDTLSLLLPLIYVLYAPLVAFLEFWLPRYAASFELFALLLPLCVFNGKMDVVGMTMLKVLREESRLLLMNLAALAISAVGSFVGTYALHSIDFIVLWITVCIVGRCIYAELYVAKKLFQPTGAINTGSIVVTIVAIMANSFMGLWAAEAIIIASYVIYLIVFRRETATALVILKRH